ncbi:MAG: malonic semialdehyde reductase [Burkholderiales bacterium]|jgi:3-hydroxypropanoate dehydrogenase|nr:malonic semialdehyde reductase [Burkholderiales bacterium]
MTTIDTAALDQLFRTARTHNAFSGEVTEADVRALYDLVKMGPTTANAQPARFVFLLTRAARERLAPALAPGNLDKTLTAPCTVIVAHDLEFYEQLPRTFPHTDARSWFAGKPEHIATTALRNGSLQGAYLILAARALGFDTGPMSGFDNAKVDAEFFPDGKWKSNFLVNLGRGDASKIFPRNPRLAFEEACRVL